jgi:hypothetical protein
MLAAPIPRHAKVIPFRRPSLHARLRPVELVPDFWTAALTGILGAQVRP